MDRVIGAVVIAIGVLAFGIGVLLARTHVRLAHRAHQRTTALQTIMPESWNAWFLGGFSVLTAGTSRLWAVGAWLVWTLAGLGLVGLGIRVLARV